MNGGAYNDNRKDKSGRHPFNFPCERDTETIILRAIRTDIVSHERFPLPFLSGA